MSRDTMRRFYLSNRLAYERSLMQPMGNNRTVRIRCSTAKWEVKRNAPGLRISSQPIENNGETVERSIARSSTKPAPKPSRNANRERQQAVVARGESTGVATDPSATPYPYRTIHKHGTSVVHPT